MLTSNAPNQSRTSSETHKKDNFLSLSLSLTVKQLAVPTVFSNLPWLFFVSPTLLFAVSALNRRRDQPPLRPLHQNRNTAAVLLIVVFQIADVEPVLFGGHYGVYC